MTKTWLFRFVTRLTVACSLLFIGLTPAAFAQTPPGPNGVVPAPAQGNSQVGTAAPLASTPFVPGDIFTDIGRGQVNHFTSTGTLRDVLNDGTNSTYTTGDCFDAAQNLYVTNFDNPSLSKFDKNGNLVASVFASLPNFTPESCLFDSAGNLYVGGPGAPTIQKLSSTGAHLRTFNVQGGNGTNGTDWIDLAVDQCTMLYDGEGTVIRSFNVCSNTQNPDFATNLPGSCFALRIRPNGGEVLIACNTQVVRFSATGAVIRTYAVGNGNLFALNLDPDGASFWTADDATQNVFHVRIADGAVLGTFNGQPNGGNGVFGLAVFGEIVAAQPSVTLSPGTDTRSVGAAESATAQLNNVANPNGTPVKFTVTGTNPQTATNPADASGKATFTYTGSRGGVDNIQASFTYASGNLRMSNTSSITWNAVTGSAACIINGVQTLEPGATVQLFSGTSLVATTTADNTTAAYAFAVAPGSYSIKITKGSVICGGPIDSSGGGGVIPGPQPSVIDLHNHSWPNAVQLDPLGGGTFDSRCASKTSCDEHLTKQDQSDWFRFKVQPGGKAILVLRGVDPQTGQPTSLPANYRLSLYKDISKAFNQLNSQPGQQDLTHVQADFAPDDFSPDDFSPDDFSPDASSPDDFSPDDFSPDDFSPDAITPDDFSPDDFSPDDFSPDDFSADAFTTVPFNPARDVTTLVTPGETVSRTAFASAQTRSLLAVSAHAGTAGQGIRKFIWDNAGDFYVRVRGRNGGFSTARPFRLEVTELPGTCAGVSASTVAHSLVVPTGGYQTIFLTDYARLALVQGTSATDISNLQTALAALSGQVAGYVVDVGQDARVANARLTADNHKDCPVAENYLATAIKEIVDQARQVNPVKYVVLIGSDEIVPFFRYPDQAGLANEDRFSPPVLDNSESQASLKLGYVLGQDRYGSNIEVSRTDHTFTVPDLPVGRLPDSAAADLVPINNYLALANPGVVPTPTSALVTGYDFFADAARQMCGQLTDALGPGGTVDRLITDPKNNPGCTAQTTNWTADDLKGQLLGKRHDLMFLGAHFSQATALAADYSTRLLSSDVANSGADLSNAIIWSLGCHSGYNTVRADAISGVTLQPDFPQTFVSMGATLVGGSGYQYGDTDFIENGERLYLGFTQQLRAGTGPRAVGSALVDAKKAYIANTPTMRGIHEKTIEEATLYGLPFLQLDVPNHATLGGDSSIAHPGPVASDPGRTLGLSTDDETITPTLTVNTKNLRVSHSDFSTTATWLSGRDGVVSNPGEPVLPLERRNVSVSNTVLRGVGFRAGTYSDTQNVLPLVGAPATEASAPHTMFASGVLYPIRPWSVNYFDALSGGGGATRLGITPAQYITTSSDGQRGTLRQINSMTFRLYYSGNTTTYAGNTPGLAVAPVISHVAGVPATDRTSINFSTRVEGDPSAGVQDVWVTYTATSGPFAGKWQSLDLKQAAPPYNATNSSNLWSGTLQLGAQDSTALRFIVQAANGVGLVSLDTNLGQYYTPGADTVDPNKPKDPTSLTLSAPTSAIYRETASFSAVLTSKGVALSGKPLTFGFGSERHLAITDANGRATVTEPLLQLPNTKDQPTYDIHVAFDESPDLLPSTADAQFIINKRGTTLSLGGGTQSPFVATLKDTSSQARALHEQTVFFVLTDPAGLQPAFATTGITDTFGRAVLSNVPLPAGTYNLAAYFACDDVSPVTVPCPITLGNPTDPTAPQVRPVSSTYMASAATAQVTLAPPDCYVVPIDSNSIQIHIQDAGIGLQSINVASLTNGRVDIPPYQLGITSAPSNVNTFGTTSEVVATITKLDATLSTNGDLIATDMAGNTADCDPVLVQISGRDRGEAGDERTHQVTISHLARGESKVTILNDTPGLSQLRVIVDGKRLEITHLRPGEVRVVDVASLLKPGLNTIVLEAQGKPGGNATVMISN